MTDMNPAIIKMVLTQVFSKAEPSFFRFKINGYRSSSRMKALKSEIAINSTGEKAIYMQQRIIYTIEAMDEFKRYTNGSEISADAR